MPPKSKDSNTTVSRPSPSFFQKPPSKSGSLSEKQKMLYLHLREAVKDPLPGARRIAWGDLLEIHNADPKLRTTESFNILILNAIRRRRTGAAESLFRHMHEAGCHPNRYTWRLRIRLYLVQGRPDLARSCAFQGLAQNSENPHATIPLSIWAQLLRPGGRKREYALKTSEHSSQDLPKPGPRPWRWESESVTPDNPYHIPLDELFSPNFLSSLPHSFTSLDYRTAADVVSYLRSHDQADDARKLTLQWVNHFASTNSEGHHLSQEESARILHIVNRNLHDHVPDTLTRFKSDEYLVSVLTSQLELLDEVHRICPTLPPNPHTTTQLFRVVRRMRRRVGHVRILIERLEHIWGPTILDFRARIQTLSTILADDRNDARRGRDLVERLILDLEREMVLRKAAIDSGRLSAEFGEEISGEQAWKYIMLRRKALKKGVLQPEAWERIQAEVKGALILGRGVHGEAHSPSGYADF
ncbi:hypothetical protein DL93DRAFT_2094826 [Clavulina sp. PMI_390]|nr:hypothetical protein DL93DRAFT_2094826 [Clavulina sp. PMI_390]